MKRKPNKLLLALDYHLNQLIMKLMEICFNISHLIKHRRIPRKMDKKEFAEFKKFINQKRNCNR